MNIFEQAVRQQLRFSINGIITIEQLYKDFNKSSAKTVLKQYASQLKKELEGFASFDIFDEGSTPSKEQKSVELRLEIIKQLYTEIITKEKQDSERLLIKQREQELLEDLAIIQREERKSKTKEQILKELEELKK